MKEHIIVNLVKVMNLLKAKVNIIIVLKMNPYFFKELEIINFNGRIMLM